MRASACWKAYSGMEGPELEISELGELERLVADATAKPKRLTFSLLQCMTDNFSDEHIIGKGGFGVVYMGRLPSGLRIAVKKMNDFDDGSGGNGFEDTVSTLMKVAHKNIVRFIGYCSQTSGQLIEFNEKHVLAEVRERLICMEYMPKGSMNELLNDNYNHAVDWNQRYQILKGICHGLRHLHDEVHVVHSDIKPENILLDENLVPKISDFGLSFDRGESLTLTRSITMNVRGTMGYIAPEMINERVLSFKSDVFSLGVTILNFLAGPNFLGQSPEQVLKKLRNSLVKAGSFSSWEDKYYQIRTCVEIGYNCMKYNPRKRPKVSEIIQLLDETESTNYAVSSGQAPPFWTSVDDESDLSDTDTIVSEPESTDEFPPIGEEVGDLDTKGETSTQEHDKPDTVSKLSASVDLSKLKFLSEITDEFSHKRIVGKDGTFTGSHKAFVYKGDIPHQPTIAVKRLIGVEIPVEKFKWEAEQFMSLVHKNIVKVAGYCHDESGGPKLVQFKGRPLPQLFNGPEQLLCYEYVHNGSLREYLAGQGSREVDWHMRYKLIKGTCEGLHYLHKGRGGCPIVHLNLSPSNVLLDENNVPRIRGFDFSKLIGEKNTKSMVLKLNGSIAYLPPDFFHSKGTDLKYLATVDIYSLGLMILEMTTQQEIKAGKHGKLIECIEENWREESQMASLYTSLEADKLWQVKLCIDIGLACVNSKPEKRPTAGDIMLWLDKQTKPVLVPRAGPGGVPRPPVRTNIIQVDDHIQEKEKRMGLTKLFGFFSKKG